MKQFENNCTDFNI